MEDKHELEQVNWGVIPIYNYSGTLVTRVYGKGYSVFGQIVSTPEEVDEVIQNACSSLSESIVNRMDGSMECLNSEKCLQIEENGTFSQDFASGNPKYPKEGI